MLGGSCFAVAKLSSDPSARTSHCLLRRDNSLWGPTLLKVEEAKMLAEEKLRQGDVAGALTELKRSIQQDPANGKYRVFLFQLLSLQSKWSSAQTQLEIAGDLDHGNLAMVQAYREAIRCEVEREAVFEGKQNPTVFGEPDRWIALLLESLKSMLRGQFDQANALRSEAFDLAPTSAGKLILEDNQEEDFDWISDADGRFGPVVEVFMNGQYYWVPFHRIARIQFERPVDLRDFVWTPANFTWMNGGETIGFISSRYPCLEADADSLLQLSRRTEWKQRDSELDLGVGQRMFVTDKSEYGLLDIREVVFNQQFIADKDPDLLESAADSFEPGEAKE
ncbi:MAG: type VI secretion system accessory protein TagJ [Rubripirellula sp.]